MAVAGSELAGRNGQACPPPDGHACPGPAGVLPVTATLARPRLGEGSPRQLEMVLCVVAVVARLCEHPVRGGDTGREGRGRWHGCGLWLRRRRLPAWRLPWAGRCRPRRARAR